MYFYGDKLKWKSIANLWKVELGPLLRFGIDEFLSGSLEIDLDSVRTVKEAKKNNFTFFSKINIFSRGIYLTLNKVEFYKSTEFWQKNADANIKLMNLGISARKKKRKFGKILNT